MVLMHDNFGKCSPTCRLVACRRSGHAEQSELENLQGALKLRHLQILCQPGLYTDDRITKTVSIFN